MDKKRHFFLLHSYSGNIKEVNLFSFNLEIHESFSKVCAQTEMFIFKTKIGFFVGGFNPPQQPNPSLML